MGDVKGNHLNLSYTIKIVTGKENFKIFLLAMSILVEKEKE